ncbi:MAG: hypothetical protein JXA89_23175 [Anaerolineae bacterium]|nr:hypothetical protein [Anaerolineae bacterium]
MEKHNSPTCSKDGFPKVKIDGRWHCVAEYLDRCIGGQHVVDVVQRGDPESSARNGDKTGEQDEKKR